MLNSIKALPLRVRPVLLASACGLAWALCAASGAHAATVNFAYTGSLQQFTVPAGVTLIKITASGAQGGTVTGNGGPFPGGLGATMAGEFTVTPGSVLQLVVGGQGNPDASSSGGGGGSGVNQGGVALIVAGGGGGIDFQQPDYAGRHATTATTGVPGNTGGAGGTAGADGDDTIYSGSNISRGGRGWNAGNTGSLGQSGVSSNTTFTAGTWGLGGGGGSVGYGWCNCGGGGGGYSGGGSGGINASGGGGGSINTGTNQVNLAGDHAGNGVIVLEYEAQVVATPVPLFSWWALVALSPLLVGGGAWSLRRQRRA